MSFNTFGKIFRFTTWGESHGPAIGCVIDGVPPNISISEREIQSDMDRRRPGQSKFTLLVIMHLTIYPRAGYRASTAHDQPANLKADGPPFVDSTFRRYKTSSGYKNISGWVASKC